jgi:hypothetical protein
MFEPYKEMRQPDTSTRSALCQVAAQAMKTGRRAYAFVNNRLEGNAPTTIEAVASELGV